MGHQQRKTHVPVPLCSQMHVPSPSNWPSTGGPTVPTSHEVPGPRGQEVGPYLFQLGQALLSTSPG